MGKDLIKEADKLNVLCLHGYRQNAESFSGKTGSFRKFVKKFVNFTYITAPHLAKPIDESDTIDETQRSWWFNKDDMSFKGTNKNGPAFGFEESLKLVEEEWNKANYQGLLGFSQGACFASLIASMSVKSLTTIKPRFIMLVAGFPSGSLVHKNFYEQKISLPSLHVYGLNDDIISHELSMELQESFDNPLIQTHQGGHYFPATANEKQSYVDFYRNQLICYLEEKELQKDANCDVIKENE